MGALFASNSLLDKSADDVVEEGLLTAKDKTTIMIMGVDERDDDVGRSDTLMVGDARPEERPGRADVHPARYPRQDQGTRLG